MIKEKEKEDMNVLMVQFMMEIGLKIREKELGNKSIKSQIQ